MSSQIIYLVQTSQLLVKMKRTELRVKARRRRAADDASPEQQQQETPLSSAVSADEAKKDR